MLSFNIKGCRLSLSAGFFALVTLMLMTCDISLVLISMMCSFFHEFGHISAMLFYGERLKDISFTAVGIRIDKLSAINLSYRQEIVISLAGIAFNCLFALACLLIHLACHFDFLHNAALVSLLIAGFNLLPIDTLDGGRALSFFLLSRLCEKQAETVMLVISLISIFILIAFSILMIRLYSVNLSLVIAVVYLASLFVCQLFKIKEL